MKEYDRVELINDRQEYLAAGGKKGDKGTILGENRLGYWLVYFDGEIFQDEDGIWSTTEIDVGVKEEDLKVIKESDKNSIKSSMSEAHAPPRKKDYLAIVLFSCCDKFEKRDLNEVLGSATDEY